MSRLRLLLLFLIMLLILSFGACEDNSENYTTSPDDIISFSTDTLSFDTILSTVTTPTLGLRVYNRNSKPLLISSIDLSENKKSGFNINVDGVAGTHFENVEIGAEDSIFILVNVKLNENGQTLPVYINDYIVFTTNSVQQKIVLEAYGQDTYVWHGKVIETSETLPNDKPYLIYDSLEVKENATLTLQEGTVFYMHSKASIKVRGTLIAKGTMDKRIIIRGDRMDNDYVVNIPYDRVPGQWGGVQFAASSFNNELDYVWIRNGSYGLDFDLSEPTQSKLKILNSIVTNVTGNLISAQNCRIEAENCEFSNARYYLLSLYGGVYNFNQCTMANYYPSNEQWGSSKNSTIYLTNKSYKLDTLSKKMLPQALPLEQASFSNCIVYSNILESGINLQKDTIDFPSTKFNYQFQNCLVLYNGKDKQQFTNCIFNENPKFINTKLTDIKEKSLPYDFRLTETSPARNVANVPVAEHFPYDMNGISRFQDEGPDIGAYEYVKSL